MRCSTNPWMSRCRCSTERAEEIRRDHYETLAQCDGVLLYWGRSGEGWLRTMLRDMKKVFGLGRTSPYKATAIYLARLPDPKKEAFRTLDATIIRARCGTVRPARSVPLSPVCRVNSDASFDRQQSRFPDFGPYTYHEAALFFGRDQQSDELVRRLASTRFLAVVGTSGSGKSSLVRAGLLPSLEAGFMAGAGAHWRFCVFRPQNDPLGFLTRALIDSGVLPPLDLSEAAARAVVETTLRRSSLGLIDVGRLARLDSHENVAIVVDQFEELFRFADEARRAGKGDDAPAFVRLLLEASRQTSVPIYVVLTMRSDFLGDCTRFRDLPEAISNSQYLVPRLTRDELKAAITGPLGVSGAEAEPMLVQELLNSVGDDMDQLPLLQHALMRTWGKWQGRLARTGRSASRIWTRPAAWLTPCPSTPRRRSTRSHPSARRRLPSGCSSASPRKGPTTASCAGRRSFPGSNGSSAPRAARS